MPEAGRRAAAACTSQKRTTLGGLAAAVQVEPKAKATNTPLFPAVRVLRPPHTIPIAQAVATLRAAAVHDAAAARNSNALLPPPVECTVIPNQDVSLTSPESLFLFPGLQQLDGSCVDVCLVGQRAAKECRLLLEQLGKCGGT